MLSAIRQTLVTLSLLAFFFPAASHAQSDFLQAGNGDDVSKVFLTWSLPTLSAGANELRVHRSLTPTFCSGLLQAGISPSQTTFVDTLSVIPGTFYFYSIEAVGPFGAFLGCSELDSGYARISPPLSVAASDGTFTDKVRVTWQPPILGGTINGYNLYRGTACNTLIQGNISAGTLTFDDTSVTPGVTYQYSLRTISPTGLSDCSPFDPGYAVTVCTNGIDDDGDGLADYPSDPGCTSPFDNSEKEAGHVCDDGADNDGDQKIDFRIDGSGDPGCDGPTDSSETDGEAAISSPAFAKFNTYLGQWNFAELVNQGTTGKVIQLTVYNLRGQEMIRRGFFVPAGSQVDVDVNALIQFACDILASNCEGFEDRSATANAPNGANSPDGIVDTYGLVRFDWDDTNANDRLFGRMSFYRPNKDGSFSFAFAREFRNRLNGTSFAMSNTYDPTGGQNLTPNWVEVINFGTKGPNGTHLFVDQTYTVNIYTQDGKLKESRTVSLPPLGEFDVHGGHEYLTASGAVEQTVYLVEVIPTNPDAEYFLSVARYNSNSPKGVDPESYNFALVLDGKAGTTNALFAPSSNTLPAVSGLALPPTVDNWVETGCASASACHVNVKFKDSTGAVVSTGGVTIPPKGQFHFNGAAMFSTKQAGSVEIHSDQPIVAQSMYYLHGGRGELLSGFASNAKGLQRAKQIGTLNTFLGMTNQLTLISTASQATSAAYKIVSFGTQLSSGSLGLNAGAASALGISNGSTIQFPSDHYGTIEFSTPADGQIVGEVQRTRIFNGQIDFVMPTAVR